MTAFTLKNLLTAQPHLNNTFCINRCENKSNHESRCAFTTGKHIYSMRNQWRRKYSVSYSFLGNFNSYGLIAVIYSADVMFQGYPMSALLQLHQSIQSTTVCCTLVLTSHKTLRTSRTLYFCFCTRTRY